MDYSKTVNLLQTNFPMKADLPVREPAMVEQWEKSNLYARLQKKGDGKPVFLLHDGPPYANGEIHMGHALNKVLKDIVVKYKTLDGYHAPFKPGWDCHGLPIEHQLFKQMGKNKHQVARTELRKKATEYALAFVDKQRADFKRLGVLGAWETPYLTLAKEYEAGIVETFFGLRDKGFIYRGLKPVTWCAFDETALAEAEVEHADKKSESVYVRFEVVIASEAKQSHKINEIATALSGPRNDSKLYILIWTTTPWTLPANTGLAFHPDESYVFLSHGNHTYIIAKKLSEKITRIFEKKGGFVTVKDPNLKGSDFLGMTAVNPLHGRTSQVVNARYITMEDGTGIVHIAPGHGVEDFNVGQEYKLEVLSPVDERGFFDKNVGRDELKGKHVLKDANAAVIELLGENLIFHHTISHSYPHCWRCKNPIIFRATEQWFLRVDEAFRQKLLDQIDKVRWEPAYGIHRIKGMVEVRPDWCLSRQRHWGAPIAVFFCKKCREPLNNSELNKKIVHLIATEGTDAWYEISFDVIASGAKQSHEIASAPSGPRNDGIACACGGKEFEKETDILDVWYDSGVSWYSVVEKEFSKVKPETVMYLEGSDQHRGWFQTSLIPSVALRDKAPYDLVLTHGFVVDGKGHKMSKSLGNVIAPQEINQKFGADVLRLWVAMSDYREDVRMSQDIVKHMVDVYRRFRNTFRFFLQNTADFKWKDTRVAFESLEEVDRWILVHFEDTKARVKKAYDAYEFHVVLSELNRFVAVPLSGFYLDALKDRLYCDALNSARRRSCQTALFQLARGLSVLLAPVLSFTSEEAYLELRSASDPSLPDSVFLDSLQDLPAVRFDEALNQKWLKVLEIRSLVNDELDRQRKAGLVKSSQGAAVRIHPEKLEKSHSEFVVQSKEDWPFVLQMAEVAINGQVTSSPGAEPAAAVSVDIKATSFAKCERCWRHRPEVGRSKEHPALCDRCLEVVKEGLKE